jgi:hypothetical protein
MTQFDGNGNLDQVDFATLNGIPRWTGWRSVTGTYQVNADLHRRGCAQSERWQSEPSPVPRGRQPRPGDQDGRCGQRDREPGHQSELNVQKMCRSARRTRLRAGRRGSPHGVPHMPVETLRLMTFLLILVTSPSPPTEQATRQRRGGRTARCGTRRNEDHVVSRIAPGLGRLYWKCRKGSRDIGGLITIAMIALRA